MIDEVYLFSSQDCQLELKITNYAGFDTYETTKLNCRKTDGLQKVQLHLVFGWNQHEWYELVYYISEAPFSKESFVP